MRRTDLACIFPDDETIAPIDDVPVISPPAAASRSDRPAPDITATISASHGIPRDSIRK